MNIKYIDLFKTKITVIPACVFSSSTALKITLPTTISKVETNGFTVAYNIKILLYNI